MGSCDCFGGKNGLKTRKRAKDVENGVEMTEIESICEQEHV